MRIYVIKKESNKMSTNNVSSIVSSVDFDPRKAMQQYLLDLSEQWDNVSYHFEVVKGKLFSDDFFNKEIMIIRPFVRNPNEAGFKKAEDLGLPTTRIEKGEFDYTQSVMQCKRIAAEIKGWAEKFSSEQ